MSRNGTKISLTTATITGLNAMIGSGIFTAPAAIAGYVGPAGIVAYLFVILAVWFMATSFARLAELYPQEGSFYTYAKQWGGHTAGIIASGLYLMGLMIAMGLLCRIAGGYIHQSVPALSATCWGTVTLLSLVTLNMFGVALTVIGQQILIVCTILPLAITTIMCFSKAQWANLFPFAPYGFTNALKATRMVIFGFFGFECTASLFSIVENPARNVPRALAYSIVIVGIVYILFVSSVILSTPMHLFSDPFIPFSVTLQSIFPGQTWLLCVVHWSIIIAIIGTVHSMIWSSAELLVSLAHRICYSNQLPGVVHTPAHKRYAVLAIGAAILSTFLTLHNINLFFSLTATCLVSAFILAIATLLTLKEEWRSGKNIRTVIGMLTALLILFFALENVVGEIYKVM